MREDIISILKNAIEHGGNPSRIAQSLINSGYPAADVQQALSSLSSTISHQSQIPPQSINNYPLTINHSNINSSPAILGASTKKAIPKQNKNTVNSLSFLSFSYSLLTITSILIKMKL